jgi:hypothetical protein
MSWSYTTVEQLANVLSISEASSTEPVLQRERLLGIIEGISQDVDRETERTFRTFAGTYAFTPQWDDYLLLPDLLSVDEMLLDYNQDGTREITLSPTTDYLLEPTNAPLNERPYTRLRMRRNSAYFLPNYEESLAIEGTWGYWQRLRATGVTLTTAIDTDGTEIEVSDYQRVQTGWTLKLGSEQLYVRDRNAAGDGKLTVVRAQNGTTAASHLVGAAISRYVYPEGVTQAALMMAARLYRRQETPLGIVNNPGDIGWRAVYIPKEDVDVVRLLRRFMKRNIL